MLREHHQKHPNWALPDDEDRFAWRDARLVDGLQARVHRLDKCGFLQDDVRRQHEHPALDDPRHCPNILSEPAAIGVKSGRKPHSLVSGALREKSVLAIKAPTTGKVMKARYAIAGFEFRDARAHSDHRAGKLVTQDLRRSEEAVMNLLDISSANAARPHAEHNLTFAYFRDRHALDLDAPLAAIHASPHEASSLSFGVLLQSDLCHCLTHQDRCPPSNFVPIKAVSESLSSVMRTIFYRRCRGCVRCG